MILFMTYDINSFDTSSVFDGCMYMYANNEIKIKKVGKVMIQIAARTVKTITFSNMGEFEKKEICCW